MKKHILLGFITLLFGLIFGQTVFAASTVQFEGGAENFVFYPDGAWTSTDLFGSLQNLMPGDQRTETITVKNLASDYDYVKIYLRAETTSDANSLLSHLTLNLYQAGELLSSTSASNTGALTTNFELGTFTYGEETLLAVEIIAPSSLGNNYLHTQGEINWIFTAEAYKDGQIVAPDTGIMSTSGSTLATETIILAAVATTALLASTTYLIHRQRQSNR